ncbi:MAG TPA: hypothetical protein VF742_16965 [Terracidiphilus sp.]
MLVFHSPLEMGKAQEATTENSLWQQPPSAVALIVKLNSHV